MDIDCQGFKPYPVAVECSHIATGIILSPVGQVHAITRYWFMLIVLPTMKCI